MGKARLGKLFSGSFHVSNKTQINEQNKSLYHVNNKHK